MGGSVRVLTTVKPLWKTPIGKQVVENFKKYKSEQIKPIIFGRDAPLSRPTDAKFAELHHIHIGNFNEITRQYSRTSDSWLIYTVRIENPNCFLLIDILTPNAHKDAERHSIMQPYIDAAESFRSANLPTPNCR